MTWGVWTSMIIILIRTGSCEDSDDGICLGQDSDYSLSSYFDPHDDGQEGLIDIDNGSIFDESGRFDVLNPTIGPEGEQFFEGDMVLEDTLEEVMFGHLERKFIPERSFLWPSKPETGLPNVPFMISSSANKTRKIILDAIAMWENSTCITFSELTKPTKTSYISFVGNIGCWSYVGRQYRKQGPQSLSVGRGCFKPGIIAHEIGHALGMLHEQSRSDRDDHVVVVWDNIKPQKFKNFRKRNSENGDVPYDSSSIMHYGGSFFSKAGKLTLLTKNPLHQWHIGQRNRLTFRDIHIANNMYGCTERWSQACKNEGKVCFNEGYVGEGCVCRCPPGTSGDQCEERIGDYYPELRCGGNITEPTNISTPNFPEPFPSDTWCSWWIQAEACQQVKIKFHTFDLMYRTEGSCYFDTLEIRDSDPVSPGKEFCGCEITKGQQFTSKNGSLALSFHGRYQQQRGFNATIDFVEEAICIDQFMPDMNYTGANDDRIK